MGEETAEEKKVLKDLEEAGWTICSKFTCEDCPIELNCPFEQLITLEEAHKWLKDKGYVVLYGPGGMWGVFTRGNTGYSNKLRMVDDRDFPEMPKF